MADSSAPPPPPPPPTTLPPPPPPTGGRRSRRGRKTTLKAKTLRRMLKKKGMKTTGKKATLMKRLHMKGGYVGLTPGVFPGGGENTMGPLSNAGNRGEPGRDYADDVSASLSRDQQNGGRRRRRTRGRGY